MNNVKTVEECSRQNKLINVSRGKKIIGLILRTGFTCSILLTPINVSREKLSDIVAAQAGKHNEKRESYGDSIIIDPWGTVIA